MQFDSFWPPRRARDRLTSEYYYRRHPGIPWLPRGAIEALPDLLRPTDTLLEWGSGSSTTWFAKRVKRILSAEHDRAWFDRVQGELREQGLDPTSVRLLSPDPADRPHETPYVRLIDEIPAGDLDVCFIDGEHRGACANEVVPKLRSGGMLIIDDAHGVLDHPTTSPHSRYGRGPAAPDWVSLLESVAGWRMIWTSDGFSDCAIWFKP